MVGVLWPGAEPPAPPRMESFRQTLRQLGFVEGQNIGIELRYARGGLQQLPALAAELVGLKPDVLFAPGDLAPKIAQQATSTIPIVAMSDDILGAGLVASLSHPGGNTTGLTIMAPELSAKRLEVLREMVPGMTRVAALWDPTTGASQVGLTERAAKSLNLDLQVLEVRRREDVGTAFRAARDGRADAINVFSSPFLASFSARSSFCQPSIGSRPSTNGKSTSKPEDWSPLDQTLRRCSDRRQRSWSSSSKAPSRETFRSNSQRNSSWR